MATTYARSTDGNDADSGLTWALADATAAAAITAAGAGGTVWLSQIHAETVAASVTWASPGTKASPQRIMCGNDGTEPPTATTTGATVSGTSTHAEMQFNGGTCWVEGVVFTFGSGAGQPSYYFNNNANPDVQVFKTCEFRLAGSSANGAYYMGRAGAGSNGGELTFIDCKFRFGGTGQRVAPQNKIRIFGGSIDSAGSTPTSIFRAANLSYGVDVQVTGLDMTGLTATINMAEGGSSTYGPGTISFFGCKMPSSWSGGAFSSNPSYTGMRVEMHACDSADGMYYERAHDYAGKLREEPTYVRTGGATVPNSKASGATDPQPISWKVETTANCEFPVSQFRTLDMAVWNATTGSAKTATVNILFDSASELNDDDIWLEIVSPNTAGETRYAMGHSGPTTVATAATDLNTKYGAGSGWYTTGLANAKQRQLEVSFTPQEKGYVVARVVVTKPSLTVYVDPKIEIS